MTISLTLEQENSLRAWVARGDFASIEQAARQLIDERIAERLLEERRHARREVLLAGELSDSEIDAIAHAEMSPRHWYLDQELK